MRHDTGSLRLSSRRIDSISQLKGRVHLHELALVLFGFVWPIDSHVDSLFLAQPHWKEIAQSLALVTCGFICLRALATGNWRQRVPILSLFAAYLIILLLTSMYDGASLARFGALSQFTTPFLGYAACEQVRAGSFFRVALITSVCHLIYALILGQRVLATGIEVERLSGGSHPILLGFEASIVALYGLWGLFSSFGFAQRISFAALASLGIYSLLEAFSRTSLITFGLALVVWYINWGLRSFTFVP
jgi:hypothetical protein